MANFHIDCGARFALALMFSIVAMSAEARPSHPVGSTDTARKETVNKSTDKAGSAPVRVDRQAEAKVNALVQSHLPELRRVLDRLRTDEPRQYARAIRDLAKSARKLELAKKRDERLYDIEVELLKSTNQVNLLTAKLKVRDNRANRKELRLAAQQLLEARAARATYDVELFRDRLQRTEKQLNAAQKRLDEGRRDPQKTLEKTYRQLLRDAGREPEK